MMRIKLTGKRVVGGAAEGEALVTIQQISFMGGVDAASGIVKEKGHELEGKCVAGKILVFPRGKGSSEGTLKLYEMSMQGTAPAASSMLSPQPAFQTFIATSRNCSSSPLAVPVRAANRFIA